ncbi:uncharacterized protein LOC135376620 [Ornithodoros turicata]|uniref:uncharacterized protein LOC135376620 n=1 Tax=Ornithodoros turicata TaxID=34597 RepID=UPI003139C37E
MRAFHSTFSQSTTKGCLFHFGQCLQRKLSELGLKTLYCGNGAHADERYSSIRAWLRRCSVLSLLPPELVHPHWSISLKPSRPRIDGDPRIDGALDMYVEYFERQWLQNVDLWNFWDDADHIRTNNHVEGWHNSLRAKFHSSPHMSLSKFLVEYQCDVHNTNQVRIRQLLNGAPPNPRHPNYARNNMNIDDARASFSWTYESYSSGQMTLEAPFTNIIEQFAHNINCYLQRVSYLLGTS